MPTYACPTNDGQQVVDGFGNSYLLKCSGDTSGGSQYSSGTNVYSFNDCFYMCSTNTGLANPCTAFTYVGGANGQGGGTCYLKTQTTNMVFNSAADTNHVAGIRAQYYAAFTTTTTTAGSTSAVSPVQCIRLDDETQRASTLIHGMMTDKRCDPGNNYDQYHNLHGTYAAS